MFKKIILSLSALLLISSNANASFVEEFLNSPIRPYVGIDGGLSLANGSSFPYNIHAGVEVAIEEIALALEAYYQGYTEEKSDYIWSTRHVKQYVFGVDALVFPYDFGKLRSFAGLGLGYINHEMTFVGDGSQNSMTWRPEHKKQMAFSSFAGIRYDFTNNISARFRIKYFTVSGNADFTVGINYLF